MRDGANTQYATSTSFLFTVYSDLLAKYNQKVKCGVKEFDSSHLLDFARKQVSINLIYSHINFILLKKINDVKEMKIVSNFYISSIQRQNLRQIGFSTVKVRCCSCTDRLI
jgi:hypothetical protein